MSMDMNFVRWCLLCQRREEFTSFPSTDRPPHPRIVRCLFSCSSADSVVPKMLTTFLPGWPYQGLGLFSGCAGDAQPWPGWSLHSSSHLLSRLSFFVDRSYMLLLWSVRQGRSNCVVRPKSRHSYICQVLS